MSISNLSDIINPNLSFKMKELSVDTLETKSLSAIDYANALVLFNASGVGTALGYQQGYYTPILTPISNINSISVNIAMYERIGNFVKVSINGNVQTISTASGNFQFELPVIRATNFTNIGELTGSGERYNIISGTGSAMTCYAELATNNLGNGYIFPSTVTTDNFNIIFFYSLV